MIPSASLAIEVTELFPSVAPGSFSGPQVSAFQWEVVQAAQRRYYQLSRVPANVFVFFHNEWRRQNHCGAMAETLAAFVSANYPTDGKTVCLQPSTVEPWPDFLSAIRIAPIGGDWQVGGNNNIGLLTYEHLANRITAKNERVKHYRDCLPGWELWLLVATQFNVLCSIAVPREVESWQFAFDFDRVLLSDWERGVVKLQRKT